MFENLSACWGEKRGGGGRGGLNNVGYAEKMLDNKAVANSKI